MQARATQDQLARDQAVRDSVEHRERGLHLGAEHQGRIVRLDVEDQEQRVRLSEEHIQPVRLAAGHRRQADLRLVPVQAAAMLLPRNPRKSPSQQGYPRTGVIP